MKSDTDAKQPKAILLADYEAYPFDIKTVDLTFALHAMKTVVTSKLSVKRLSSRTANMVLDGGPYMSLSSVRIDGQALSDSQYNLTDDDLTLLNVPDAFDLEIVTVINPKENTRLDGLYVSGGMFCTQCEAEGFRHITYFPDRPDVLSVYSVRIEADKKSSPVLLSNGNPLGTGNINATKHYAEWHDPHPKPSYLFALVAGDLAKISDTFKTAEGRDVDLNIYVRAQDIDKCDYAMGALKRSMIWDEESFGLSYDLDVYNIVAVSDFNMGAMENKGLNVFNTKYVLASKETATDQDFAHVEGVIGHEYFHNWSGNRVTCRDWFQLSLKEGLTVYRDQEFSSDMGSRVIKRIDDVKVLRAAQFPEDAGPLAHPVRPESYIEINNFYTATVYNKGAEVIRMMASLIGKASFRKGMDLYFERHDGAAVTCEDFVVAMEDASGVDLKQFRLWYSQAGTPTVTCTSNVGDDGKVHISVTQSTPATPGSEHKLPMVIPIKLGFVLPTGGDCAHAQAMTDNIRLLGDGVFMLVCTKSEEIFTFDKVSSGAVPSYMREFSAPVYLKTDLIDQDYHTLLGHDTDPFNQVEVSDLMMGNEIKRLAKSLVETGEMRLSPNFMKPFGRILKDYKSDPSLTALLLSVPTENDISNTMRYVDVDALCAAREFFMKKLALSLRSDLQTVYTACDQIAREKDKGEEGKGAGERRLKNVCLTLMGVIGGQAEKEIILNQMNSSDCMTDEIAAFQTIVNSKIGGRQKIINQFYRKWKDEELVIDKWFTVQSMSRRTDALDAIEKLLNHRAFTLSNPNRVRSLVGGFAMANIRHFHDKDGRGYQLLANVIMELDSINPQVAARMLTPFGRYQKLDHDRKMLIKGALEQILAKDGLSKPVYEIASKSIAGLS